jgi:hypothetical protein
MKVDQIPSLLFLNWLTRTILIQIEHYILTQFPTWGRGFTAICYLLVEPMSVWLASECVMLIFVLSQSRRLIQVLVLVDDVHCRVFV